MFSVEGRVACVTGASSGLGRAMASALADHGAKVVGVARRAEAMEAWAAEGAGRHAVAGDAADLKGIEALTSKVSAPFGAPDILIAAAGVNPRKHADEVTLEEWQGTLDLNLSAPFFLARQLLPAMKAKGWGRIITIASLQTFRAFDNGIAYGASKAGVAQMTRAMAQAWSAHGITANALAPGFFRTELTETVFANDPAMAAHHAGMTCVGRNGLPDDMVGPMLFLASSASDYVTGQVLSVDGGYTAK